jgi:hypothetical protein
VGERGGPCGQCVRKFECVDLLNNQPTNEPLNVLTCLAAKQLSRLCAEVLIKAGGV